MPELEAGFYQQKLFEQGFACVVRRNHPRIEARMTASIYKRERHVAITAAGTGHDLVESELQRLGVERRIALSLRRFLGLGTCSPTRTSSQRCPTEWRKCWLGFPGEDTTPPFALPSFAIKQHWHERYQHDPGNRWLRGVVAELFLE